MLRLTVALVCLAGTPAFADAEWVTPASDSGVQFGAVTPDTQSAPIRVFGVGDGYVETHGHFEIVGSGTDGDRFWVDVVAAPTYADRGLDEVQGLLDVTYYVPEVDDDFTRSVFLGMSVRNVPFDMGPFERIRLPPNRTTTRTYAVMNTTPDPVQVYGVVIPEPGFAASLVDPGPIMVSPGASFQVRVDIDTTPAGANGWMTGTVMIDGLQSAGYIQAHVFNSVDVLIDGDHLGDHPIGQRRLGELVSFVDVPVTITQLAANSTIAIDGMTTGTVIPPFAHIPVTVTKVADHSHGTTIGFDLVGPTTFTFDGYADPEVDISTNDAIPDDEVLDLGTVLVGSNPVTADVTITDRESYWNSLDCTRPIAAGFAMSCPTYAKTNEPLTIPVTFTPAAPGFASAIDGNGVQYVARVVTDLHALSLVETPSYPETLPGDRATGSLVLRNTGPDAIAIPAATTYGDFAIDAPTGTIAPGDTFTFAVTFVPAAFATRHGAVMLATGEVYQLVGVAPEAAIDVPSSADFGTVTIGEPHTIEVTVTNPSVWPRSIARAWSRDPGLVAEVPADPIPPGGSAQIHVTYTPTPQSGSQQATLIIALDEASGPQRNVVITAQAYRPVTAMPDPLVFHANGTQQLVLVNTASVPYTLDAIVSNDAAFHAYPTDLTLPASGSLAIDIEYLGLVTNPSPKLAVYYVGDQAPQVVAVAVGPKPRPHPVGHGSSNGEVTLGDGCSTGGASSGLAVMLALLGPLRARRRARRESRRSTR